MAHKLYLATSARQGRGGWSYRVVNPNGSFRDASGPVAGAKPYRLRLRAAVEGLSSLEQPVAIEIVTTDQLLIDLAQRYLPAWEARGWRVKGKANLDLVRQLAPHLHRHTVTWRKITSRKGDPHAKDCSLHAKQTAARCTPEDLIQPGGPAQVRDDTELVAWTDGGCRKNPGPGGWGMLMVHHASGTTLQARGGEVDSTNNRMELSGILAVLERLRRRSRVEIRTDSRFCIDAITTWRHGWKRRGWLKADGEPPANLDLIKRLDELVVRHDLVFTWVRGHSGEPGNEHADDLCNQAMDAHEAGEPTSWEERADAPPFPIERVPVEADDR